MEWGVVVLHSVPPVAPPVAPPDMALPDAILTDSTRKPSSGGLVLHVCNIVEYEYAT